MATSRKTSRPPAVDETRAVEQASSLLSMVEQDPAAVVRELGALNARDPALALATVAALARVSSPQAALALTCLAESPLSKELRKEARRGLHRLRAAGIQVPQPVVAPEPSATPPRRAVLYDAWASAPDGVGTRVLWLLAERPWGGIHAVALVVNDIVGLKTASFRETTKKRFEAQLVQWRREEEAGWVRLPPDYASQLVGEALALNRRSGFPVPHDFQLNRDLIEGIERPFQRALIYQDISPGAARLAPDWLQQTPALLSEPELRTWFFNFDAVQPYALQLQEAQGGRLLVTPQATPERREQIISEALERVVTPELRQGLKRRLEEVAYVFWQTRRPHQARLAVAAATALEEAGVSRLLVHQPGHRLDEHPFLRAMMERSLELALHVELSGEGAELMRRSPYDPID